MAEQKNVSPEPKAPESEELDMSAVIEETIQEERAKWNKQMREAGLPSVDELVASHKAKVAGEAPPPPTPGMAYDDPSVRKRAKAAQDSFRAAGELTIEDLHKATGKDPQMGAYLDAAHGYLKGAAQDTNEAFSEDSILTDIPFLSPLGHFLEQTSLGINVGPLPIMGGFAEAQVQDYKDRLILESQTEDSQQYRKAAERSIKRNVQSLIKDAEVHVFKEGGLYSTGQINPNLTAEQLRYASEQEEDPELAAAFLKLANTVDGFDTYMKESLKDYGDMPDMALFANIWGRGGGGGVDIRKYKDQLRIAMSEARKQQYGALETPAERAAWVEKEVNSKLAQVVGGHPALKHWAIIDTDPYNSRLEIMKRPDQWAEWTPDFLDGLARAAAESWMPIEAVLRPTNLAVSTGMLTPEEVSPESLLSWAARLGLMTSFAGAGAMFDEYPILGPWLEMMGVIEEGSPSPEMIDWIRRGSDLGDAIPEFTEAVMSHVAMIPGLGSVDEIYEAFKAEHPFIAQAPLVIPAFVLEPDAFLLAKPVGWGADAVKASIKSIKALRYAESFKIFEEHATKIEAYVNANLRGAQDLSPEDIALHQERVATMMHEGLKSPKIEPEMRQPILDDFLGRLHAPSAEAAGKLMEEELRALVRMKNIAEEAEEIVKVNHQLHEILGGFQTRGARLDIESRKAQTALKLAHKFWGADLTKKQLSKSQLKKLSRDEANKLLNDLAEEAGRTRAMLENLQAKHADDITEEGKLAAAVIENSKILDELVSLASKGLRKGDFVTWGKVGEEVAEVVEEAVPGASKAVTKAERKQELHRLGFLMEDAEKAAKAASAKLMDELDELLAAQGIKEGDAGYDEAMMRLWAERVGPLEVFAAETSLAYYRLLNPDAVDGSKLIQAYHQTLSKLAKDRADLVEYLGEGPAKKAIADAEDLLGDWRKLAPDEKVSLRHLRRFARDYLAGKLAKDDPEVQRFMADNPTVATLIRSYEKHIKAVADAKAAAKGAAKAAPEVPLEKVGKFIKYKKAKDGSKVAVVKVGDPAQGPLYTKKIEVPFDDIRYNVRGALGEINPSYGKPLSRAAERFRRDISKTFFKVDTKVSDDTKFAQIDQAWAIANPETLKGLPVQKFDAEGNALLKKSGVIKGVKQDRKTGEYFVTLEGSKERIPLAQAHTLEGVVRGETYKLARASAVVWDARARASLRGQGIEPTEEAITKWFRKKFYKAVSDVTPEQLAAREGTVLYDANGVLRTETEAFRAWFGDSKVVDEAGEPLELFHGTTQTFEGFDPSRGTLAGRYGKVIYLTTNENDAYVNYSHAGGADLRSRIGNLSERIEQMWRDGEDVELLSNTLKAMVKSKDLDAKVLKGLDADDPIDGVEAAIRESHPDMDLDDVATFFANNKLVGEGPPAELEGAVSNIIPVYARVSNPVVVAKKGGTFLEEKEARAFVDSIDGQLRDHGMPREADLLEARLADEGLYLDAGADAWELDQALREALEMSFELEEYGESISNFISRAYNEVGFDGIKLNAYDAFGPRKSPRGEKIPGMDALTPDTWHWHLFEPTDAKSIFNKGAWSPEDARLLYQGADGAGAKSLPDMEEAKRLWIEKGTESPYFKKWFGASKLVDDAGKPLTLYHGGAEGVSTFLPAGGPGRPKGATMGGEIQSVGRAIYTTGDRKYAKQNIPMTERETMEGKKRLGTGMPDRRNLGLYPLYVKIESPLDLRKAMVDSPQDVKNLRNILQETRRLEASRPASTEQEIINRSGMIRHLDYVMKKFEEFVKDPTQRPYSTGPGESMSPKLTLGEMFGENGLIGSTQDLSSVFKKYGYDGIISDQKWNVPEVIVFDSNQVKSAVVGGFPRANLGTFDDTGRILYQGGEAAPAAARGSEPLFAPDYDARRAISYKPEMQPKPDDLIVVEHTTQPQYLDQFMDEGIDATIPSPSSGMGRLTVQPDGTVRQSYIKDSGLYVAPADSLGSSRRVVIVTPAKTIKMSMEAQGLGYETSIQGLYGANDALLRGKIPAENIAGKMIYDGGEWKWIPNPKSPYRNRFKVDGPRLITKEPAAPWERGSAIKRTPELTAAAKRLERGEITRAEYQKVVDEFKPVYEYTSVPKPATTADMARALTDLQAKKIDGAVGLEAGTRVGLRLDIPAYEDHGVWVPTIHRGGTTIGHHSAAAVNGATLTMGQRTALKIATGERSKTPFATIKGGWSPGSTEDLVAEAEAALKDPKWIQVGMDPERHSFFYNRKTQQPIVEAERVIQVGPLVLAKAPKYASPEQEAKLLYQAEEAVDPKAAVEFTEGGRAIIYAFEKADISSVMHESAHIFRRDLMDTPQGRADLTSIQEWAGLGEAGWDYDSLVQLGEKELRKLLNKQAKKHKYASKRPEGYKKMSSEELARQILTNAEENFARSFEKYLQDGKAPTAALHAVFVKFKQWLSEIYANLVGTGNLPKKIDKDVKAVFDRMLTGDMTEEVLTKLKKAELQNIARANGLKVTTRTKKADLVGAILARQEASATKYSTFLERQKTAGKAKKSSPSIVAARKVLSASKAEKGKITERLKEPRKTLESGRRQLERTNKRRQQVDKQARLAKRHQAVDKLAADTKLNEKLIRNTLKALGVSVKDEDKIFEEMKHLIKEYRLNFLYISSETLLIIRKDKFKRIMERYKKEINLPFWCQSRLDTFTDERTKLLKEAGCQSVSVGLEHGSEEVRTRLLKKALPNRKVYEGFQILAKYNIRPTVNSMMGLPDETRDEIFETIEINREISKIMKGNHNLNIFTFVPFSGTHLRKICIDKGYVDKESPISFSFYKESMLTMPTLSKKEIAGLEKTAPLYIGLDKSYWPDIKIAENDDDKGHEMFEKLMVVLQKQRERDEAYMKVTRAEDHLASPMVNFGGKTDYK